MQNNFVDLNKNLLKKSSVKLQQKHLNNLKRDINFRSILFKSLYKILTTSFFKKLLTPIKFLRYTNNIYNNCKLNIRIHYIYKHIASLKIFHRYVRKCLKFHHTLNQIFYPFINDLIETIGPSGFLVKCSGRFTKRQRASLVKYRIGGVARSTFNSIIDYTVLSIPLKYGVGTIKFWYSIRINNLFFWSPITEKKKYLKLKNQKKQNQVLNIRKIRWKRRWFFNY